jgi:hypothetical protein
MISAAKISSFFTSSVGRGNAPSHSIGKLRARRVSDSIPPGWEDTVVSPFDPLRETDLADATDVMLHRYVPTLPMGLQMA